MKLLSVFEAADLLNCSRAHVYALIAAGKLKKYNIALKGSKTRLSDEDVQRYMREAAA